jgi:hypothetical protein
MKAEFSVSTHNFIEYWRGGDAKYFLLEITNGITKVNPTIYL